MTTGDLLSSLSSVSDAPALEHLQNIVGGGGIDTFVPMDTFTCDISMGTVSCDLESSVLDGDLTLPALSADLVIEEFGGDITTEIEGDLTCPLQ